ncbi:MAG: ABC transporter ATP-binding protein [Cyanobacteria bacterium REEB459]|nr:ABC transporter ATP-binding protein [Cyanobacteria bacterium REEB459]
MIEVEHLSKTYGSTTALQDVSFAAESGEILGFLGPNGAGKTTTMRILAGYLPASQGTARVAGYDVHRDAMAVRQRIGYLPESPPLYPGMTVANFLTFVAQIKGVPAGDRQQRVNSSIERCGLGDKRQVLIRKLSKGYKQRVGIAQAIIHDPPVIILDEPTVGLDPRQINEVRQLIKGLAGSHTIILSTHILPEVSMTCDRIAIINRGQIVATDTPVNLTARLAGEGIYEVDLQGNGEQARALLSPLAQVREVALLALEGLPPGHHRLRVRGDNSATLGPEIAATLVQGGLALHQLRRQQASLEDVFLNLTTVDAGEAAPPEVAEGLSVAADDLTHDP